MAAAQGTKVEYASIGLLWFALQAQWTTVIPVMVPHHVATALGSKATGKEGITGTIIAVGSIIALLVPPIVGALSDRTRTPNGRRRPYLISGIVGSCVALAMLGPAAQFNSLLLYTLAFLNLQFWWNWIAGPYAGLIPDVVPASARNNATAWMNALGIIGTIFGNLLMALTYSAESENIVVPAFISLNVICLTFTLRNVIEPPPESAGTGRVAPFLRSFYLPLGHHPNFYWVLLTRFFSNMGVWWVFAFLLFYLQEVVELSEAINVLPALLGAGAVVAIPSSLVCGILVNRYGIVEVTRAMSWIVAFCAILYIAIAIYPSLFFVVPVMIVFSAAYGAYQTADWALALAVLPSSQDAGKDMGIWHVSMVLLQVIGPAMSGWLIALVSSIASPKAAYVTAFAIAAIWFVLAAIFVRKIRLV